MLPEESEDPYPKFWSFIQNVVMNSIIDDCWRSPFNGLLEHRSGSIHRHSSLGCRENVHSNLVAQEKSQEAR